MRYLAALLSSKRAGNAARRAGFSNFSSGHSDSFIELVVPGDTRGHRFWEKGRKRALSAHPSYAQPLCPFANGFVVAVRRRAPQAE